MNGGERTDDRVFADSNRLRFEMRVDEIARQWWRTRFLDPFGLTPEDVGDALSRSWSGDKRMTVTQFDGETERFSIRVDGAFGDGDFWFHARTLDLSGPVINADRLFISEGRRGQRHGRRFMGDLIQFAQRIGIATLRLDAEHIGRYAWLRVGFVPDRGSWLRLRIEPTHRLAMALPDLGERRYLEVLAMIRSAGPEGARDLAALTEAVDSNELFGADGRPEKVPLGRALFLETGSNWSGEADLTDGATLAVIEHYIDEPTP